MANSTQRIKKMWRKVRRRLIPTEWYGSWSPGTSGMILDWKPMDPKARQAHLNSCFGNVYQRELVRNLRINGTWAQEVKTENHMLLGALVGVGRYTSLSWLNLQTNKKWDESIQHAGTVDWILVSELQVGQ